MNRVAVSHRDLIVYQKAFSLAEEVFQLTRMFPREETYSLTDQVRRSSRSVCANLAESWRKRRYAKYFCSSLCVAESEAAETQVWLEFSVSHGYVSSHQGRQLDRGYDEVISMLVAMIQNHNKWCKQT